ncbi:hypothetical protein [Maricaulis alexandrii]|uniref:hypothetical protein n=1 Tax=Maricaulis alexandrii TaxID=2570354 RepID=UPI00110979F3|nr:hypothetical protein [Maricaulis alexandrii]
MANIGSSQDVPNRRTAKAARNDNRPVTDPAPVDDATLAAFLEQIRSADSWSEADARLRSFKPQLDTPTFIQLLRLCTDQFPKAHGPAFRLALLLAEQGEADAARTAYDDACARGLPHTQSDRFFLALHWTRRDWEKLATLTPELQAFPGALEAAPWLRVAFARFMCGELSGGIKALQIHAELHPGPAAHIPLITRWLIEAEACRTARHMLAALESLTPDLPELTVAGHALDVFAPNTRRDRPISATPAPDTTPVAEADPDRAAARDWALKLLRPERKAPKHDPLAPDEMTQLEQALWSALKGEYDTAADGLTAFLDRPRPETVTGRVSETLDLIRALSPLPAPRRALLQDQRGDCLVSERDPSGRVALVFSSLADRAAGMPVRFLDGILARQGFQMIFLRDYSRCAFTCGIKSLGATADATVAALRDLLAQEEARQLVTIGMSGGGYASLRYGLALGADALFSFSGGTVARPADMQALGDQRVPVVARLTERRATEADFTRPVREVLAELTGAPRLNLYFSEDSREDRAHAEDLAGFATVCLNPVSDHGRHDVFTTLLSQGFSFTAQLEPEPAS